MASDLWQAIQDYLGQIDDAEMRAAMETARQFREAGGYDAPTSIQMAAALHGVDADQLACLHAGLGNLIRRIRAKRRALAANLDEYGRPLHPGRAMRV